VVVADEPVSIGEAIGKTTAGSTSKVSDEVAFVKGDTSYVVAGQLGA